MDKDKIKEIRLLIWDISKKRELDFEEITVVAKTLRSLLDAYIGATRKLYKLRSKLRGENE